MEEQERQIGQVFKCVHCEGTGKCSCYRCEARAKKNPDTFSWGFCTVCQGKGFVWIGPTLIPFPSNGNK